MFLQTRRKKKHKYKKAKEDIYAADPIGDELTYILYIYIYTYIYRYGHACRAVRDARTFYFNAVFRYPSAKESIKFHYVYLQRSSESRVCNDY
jgi:hypothetical protein